MTRFSSLSLAFLASVFLFGTTAGAVEEKRIIITTKPPSRSSPLKLGKNDFRIGNSTFRRFVLPTGTDLNKTIETLKRDPNILNVEQDSRVSIEEVSNDTIYTQGNLWGMYSNDSPNSGPPNTTNVYGSQAERAWSQGYVGSTKVVVGVIDTGVDHTHPDLYLNIWLNPGEIKTLSFYSSLADTDADGLITFRDLNQPANSTYVTDFNENGRIDAADLLSDSRWEDGLDNDGNGYVDDLIGWDWVNGDNDPMDDHYHGTHVAGTIGGIGGNGVGVAGVNWNVLIVPLKFLSFEGSGWSSDGALAVDYFTGVAFLNDKEFSPTSPATYLGTNNSWGGGGALSMLETAINNAALKNIHFVAAAGNSSTNIVSIPFYPASYSTLSSAGWEAVLPVASIDPNGNLSWFSNFGSPVVKIGAPGGGIQSTAPGNTYTSLSGTSMATPHVMGALALAKSSFPAAGKREVSQVALSTSSPTTSLVGKVSSRGRLNITAMLSQLGDNYPGPGISVIWGTSSNDSITGTSGVDYIAGIPATGTSLLTLGKGKIDTLTGGSGNDVFRLGQRRNGVPYVFYNDGSNRTSGISDYAMITDFNPAQDKVRLVPGNYQTTVFGNTTFLSWKSGVPERVAVFRGVRLGPLHFSPSNTPAWVIFE